MAAKSRTAKFYASSPKARAVKKKYDTAYGSTPERKKDRASRNAARRKLGLKKGQNLDASHKNNNPRDNRKSNLRAESPSKNRGRK